MTIATLIQDPAADWTRTEPADAAVVDLLRAALPELPPDYLAFLGHCNGGEGGLSLEPGWFSLWPAEEVAELNASYRVADFLPGFTAFGSDGGGEMFAFGGSGARWGRVYAVPFIPMEEAAARQLAPDFATLVRAFGREMHAG